MIRSFRIQHFKSILDHEIELGRVNVFIGENGSGKTNILEALAYAAAIGEFRTSYEELFAKGVRVASAAMTASSFAGRTSRAVVKGSVAFEGQDRSSYSWSFDWDLSRPDPLTLFEQISIPAPPEERWLLRRQLLLYGIYSPSTPVLRGLVPAISHREPLGLYGEALDVYLSQMKRITFDDIQERARCIFWLDKVILDHDDHLKFKGLRPGRGTSRLYFRDRYMQKKNNVFSAENANEGILHILFYLALFASPETPPVFAIDNIEAALNPQLCRDLMKQLTELAHAKGKQALITTHNPAVLDGLNLHDDEQRLFVVSRNDDGHTVTRRIRIKPNVEGEKFKLSELWMRGHLGGLPGRF